MQPTCCQLLSKWLEAPLASRMMFRTSVTLRTEYGGRVPHQLPHVYLQAPAAGKPGGAAAGHHLIPAFQAIPRQPGRLLRTYSTHWRSADANQRSLVQDTQDEEEELRHADSTICCDKTFAACVPKNFTLKQAHLSDHCIESVYVLGLDTTLETLTPRDLLVLDFPDFAHSAC